MQCSPYLQWRVKGHCAEVQHQPCNFMHSVTELSSGEPGASWIHPLRVGHQITMGSQENVEKHCTRSSCQPKKLLWPTTVWMFCRTFHWASVLSMHSHAHTTVDGFFIISSVKKKDNTTTPRFIEKHYNSTARVLLGHGGWKSLPTDLKPGTQF